MNIMNQVVLIKLQELFGPHTTIEEVDVIDEFVNFTIPTHIDSDTHLPVDVVFCGVKAGKVQLMMREDELNRQIKTQDFINANLSQLIQRLKP